MHLNSAFDCGFAHNDRTERQKNGTFGADLLYGRGVQCRCSWLQPVNLCLGTARFLLRGDADNYFGGDSFDSIGGQQGQKNNGKRGKDHIGGHAFAELPELVFHGNTDNGLNQRFKATKS